MKQPDDLIGEDAREFLTTPYVPKPLKPLTQKDFPTRRQDDMADPGPIDPARRPVYWGKSGTGYDAEGYRVWKVGDYGDKEWWSRRFPHPRYLSPRRRLWAWLRSIFRGTRQYRESKQALRGTRTITHNEDGEYMFEGAENFGKARHER